MALYSLNCCGRIADTKVTVFCHRQRFEARFAALMQCSEQCLNEDDQIQADSGVRTFLERRVNRQNTCASYGTRSFTKVSNTLCIVFIELSDTPGKHF